MQSMNTVLIIDDEPAARESLEALLAAEGYQLEFAVDGITRISSRRRTLSRYYLAGCDDARYRWF